MSRLDLSNIFFEAASIARRRKVFFSFHYADIFRVNAVRNSGIFNKSSAEGGRQIEGFYDRSLWEKKRLEGDDALRRLIREGVKNTSVVCVLAGSETFLRPWVRYEIARSVINRKGLLTIDINGIPSHISPFGTKRLGPDPCDYMGIGRAENGAFYLCERNHVDNKFVWQWYARHGDRVDLPKYLMPPERGSVVSLGSATQRHDWLNEGHKSIGRWIDAAAQQAGR